MGCKALLSQSIVRAAFPFQLVIAAVYPMVLPQNLHLKQENWKPIFVQQLHNHLRPYYKTYTSYYKHFLCKVRVCQSPWCLLPFARAVPIATSGLPQAVHVRGPLGVNFSSILR